MSGIRWFFFAALILSIAAVAAAAASLPSPTPIPDAANEGLRVWRANGCESCHTLYGQGGVYAPDLTRIYSQRGEIYLRDFLINPQAYHPDQRVMPAFGLTRAETDSLMVYLQWIDAQSVAMNFPVRTINVNGGGSIASLDGASAIVSDDSDIPTDTIEAGRYWFSHAPGNCSVCHSLEPDVVIVGPSQAGIATRAASRIPGMSAEAYIRQSILDPGAFVVPGFPDAMARNLGDMLNSDQINQIIAFMLTLE